jgi:hypothetical protein
MEGKHETNAGDEDSEASIETLRPARRMGAGLGQTWSKVGMPGYELPEGGPGSS